MNSLKEFIKGLYEDSDNQMKDIYTQQENDKKSIFDKIGSILLTYTIIDNLLNLTLGQKNSLYDSMSNLIIKLFSKETTETKSAVTDVLKSTIKKSATYYDLEFKVGLNKNAKITSDLVNKDAEKFIKKKYKGENFSKRIWENNNEIQKEVQNEIEKLLKGETSVNDIKKNIEKKFETSKFNAKRLVESEVSRVHDEIFKKYCRDNGIDKVIYKATFCNTCDFCKKDHNKPFNLDEAPQLPRHPQCRCYYTYDIHDLNQYNDENIDIKGFIKNILTDKKDVAKNNEIKHINVKNLPNRYINDISNIVNNSPSLYKNIFLKNIDKINFININSDKAFYRPSEKGIYINLKGDSLDLKGKGKYATTFHEIGHLIDREMNRPSCRNKYFRQAIINDVNNFIEDVRINSNIKDENELIKYIKKELSADESLHSISDIIGGATKNKIVGRFGHPTDYWEKKYSLEKEVFAHFFEASIRNDKNKLSNIENIFKESYNIFKSMFRGD